MSSSSVHLEKSRARSNFYRAKSRIAHEQFGSFTPISIPFIDIPFCFSRVNSLSPIFELLELFAIQSTRWSTDDGVDGLDNKEFEGMSLPWVGRSGSVTVLKVPRRRGL